MKGFVKCPNGHMYKESLGSCPYCQKNDADYTVGNPSATTGAARTQMMPDSGVSNRTEVIKDSHEKENSSNETCMPRVNSHQGTQFESEIVERDDSGNETVRRELRKGSRLVGWLVTYTLDPLGVAFDIREGKNYIGKDFTCGINIADPMVSGVHAVILYRAGKFRIKDNLSSNGTFVNGEDIEDQHYELHDGDTIQIGDSILKFRTAM